MRVDLEEFVEPVKFGDLGILNFWGCVHINRYMIIDAQQPQQLYHGGFPHSGFPVKFSLFCGSCSDNGRDG